MNKKRLTKRVVDSLQPTDREYTVWDDALTGFGVRVRPTGAMSYVVVYRAGAGRKAPVRKATLGAVGKLTPDTARTLAQKALGDVAHGKDPARERTDARQGLTVKELVDKFLAEHVKDKLGETTADRYRGLLEDHVVPALGSEKAAALTRSALAKLHTQMNHIKVSANRMVNVVSSMYGFAQEKGVVPEDYNPAAKIRKYPEQRLERFLTSKEIQRLADALIEAETTGLPGEKGKRLTIYGKSAVTAVRLLIFTGCRVSEILKCKWEYWDIERRVLFLPRSKTGLKTVVLNAAALSILKKLPRVGPYMLPGANPKEPIEGIRRLWKAILHRANIEKLRRHDLRHTFASVGLGDNMTLAMVGKLLGHVDPGSTNRYAHLANDPARRASDKIAGRISRAMNGGARRAVKPAATKKRARRV